MVNSINKWKYLPFVLMGIMITGVATPAFADSVQPPPPSDTVEVTINNILGTNLAVTCTFPESSETAALKPLDATYCSSSLLSGLPIFFNAILVFHDQHGISDILVSAPGQYLCGQSSWCFMSNNEQAIDAKTVTDLETTLQVKSKDVTEDGTKQDVSDKFEIATLNPPATFTVKVFSDVEPTPPSAIPEFPFSFSLVIMFVVVAAVYMGIRQKMIPGFKKF